jgi:hypothetical protein
MKLVHSVCLIAALGVAMLLGPIGSAQEKPGPRLVGKILNVDTKVQVSDPPNLIVAVTGQVTTGGYTKPRLLRAVYATPPEDGIQDYFLLAIPPDGIAAQVISEVKASDSWKAYTKEAPWLKGVRVHGVNGGVVTVMLGK